MDRVIWPNRGIKYSIQSRKMFSSRQVSNWVGESRDAQRRSEGTGHGHGACWLISIGSYIIWLVVWNMSFVTFHILWTIIRFDFHIFQRGRSTTNQSWNFAIAWRSGDRRGLRHGGKAPHKHVGAPHVWPHPIRYIMCYQDISCSIYISTCLLGI